MPLRISSLNCRGLKDFGVKKKIIDDLNLHNSDITFLQETHIQSLKETRFWENQFLSKGFWSFGVHNSCGVGILLKNDLLYNLVSFQHDYEGRFICVDINMNDFELRLINIYAPNVISERADFITNLHDLVHTKRMVILGGDWNFVENICLDNVP